MNADDPRHPILDAPGDTCGLWGLDAEAECQPATWHLELAFNHLDQAANELRLAEIAIRKAEIVGQYGEPPS